MLYSSVSRNVVLLCPVLCLRDVSNTDMLPKMLCPCLSKESQLIIHSSLVLSLGLSSLVCNWQLDLIVYNVIVLGNRFWVGWRTQEPSILADSFNLFCQAFFCAKYSVFATKKKMLLKSLPEVIWLCIPFWNLTLSKALAILLKKHKHSLGVITRNNIASKLFIGRIIGL